MIANARMAFPGLLMGIMLAAPALAAPAADNTGPQSATPQHQSSRGKSRTLRAGARKPLANLANLAFDDPRAIAARAGFGAPDTAGGAVVVATSEATGNDQPRPAGPMPGGLLRDGVWHQEGVASWYGGKRWQGHRTSSGARYDERDLTAAHATLPIGTKVRVTLAGGERSVVVVINDRPGTRSRIIDLSRGAASELGIINSGVARVSLSQL